MNDLQTAKETARTQPLARWQTATGSFVPSENGLRDDKKAEKIKEVLSAFLADLYLFNDGVPLNVDPNNDYRILTFVPWAAEWRAPSPPALITTERWAARRIIAEAQEADKLSLITRDCSHYYLSAGTYTNLESALNWLESLKITGSRFRQLDNLRRSKRRAINRM
mgnify:CR=1 FL=1